jgi:hypothetical protein
MKHTFLILILFFLQGSVFSQGRLEEPIDQTLGESFKILNDSTFVLRNGLTVIHSKNNSELIKVELTIENLPHSDFQIAGVDEVTDNLLNLKSEVYSSEIKKELITMKLGLNSSNFSSTKLNFSQHFRWFANSLISPEFYKDQLNIEKQRLITDLSNVKGSSLGIVTQVGKTLSYGPEHPYGELSTIKTLNSITLQDVIIHYQRFAVPKNATLYINGDVSKDFLKVLLLDTFSNWTASNSLNSTIAETVNPQYTQLNFIQKDSLDYSVIQFVNIAELNTQSTDYPSSLVAIGLLNSLLKNETYKVQAYIEALPFASRIVVNVSVASKETPEVIMDVLDVIKNIRTQHIDTSTLNTLIAKLSKDYPNINFNEVDATKVRLASVLHIKANQMRIIVLADGYKFYERLKDITLKGKIVPIKFYNTRAERIEDIKFERRLPYGATTETVFQQYLNAIGGLEKVRKINSLTIKAKAVINETRLNLEIKKSVENNYMSQVMVGGNTLSKLVITEDSSYIWSGGQKKSIGSSDLNSLRFKAHPFLELMPEYSNLLRIETLNEKDVLVVAFSNVSEEYYDLKTGLKTQSVIVDQDTGEKIITTYRNYSNVEGVLYPSEISQKIGDATLFFEVTEIIVNPDFKPSDFE